MNLYEEKTIADLTVREFKDLFNSLLSEDKAEDTSSNRYDIPDVPDNSRYPIGKAATILGISRDTLRKYTEEGKIKCGFRRENNRRFYTGSEIKRFRKAYL